MIKAIETHYNGYRFRSRLEARWAVFFETLGFTYEYEREGYHIQGTYYLPDFYLPQLGCYAEVKAQLFSQQEFALATALKGTILLDGLPEVKLYSCGDPCAECDKAYDCYRAGHDYGRVNLPYSLGKGRLWINYGEGLDDTYDIERFHHAVMAARSARFEHGEHGPGLRSPDHPPETTGHPDDHVLPDHLRNHPDPRVRRHWFGIYRRTNELKASYRQDPYAQILDNKR